MAFIVYMYEQEKKYLEWLVFQRQNIETGGDLFGLWQKKDVAIVQLVLGPGNSCTRTATSFYQDVDYLSSVGEALTTSQGLCNIGEWHSHHRINLPSPSLGDKNTVWKHMNSVTGGRFLLFIASITESKQILEVNIGCFMFSMETRAMTEGLLVALPGYSPIRGQFSDVSFAPGPERGVSWGNFVKADKTGIINMKISTPQIIGNKQAKSTGRERRREKPEETTKLISNQPSASDFFKKNIKRIKPSKKRYSSEDEVSKQQQMRDLASPTPDRRRGKNGETTKLISNQPRGYDSCEKNMRGKTFKSRYSSDDEKNVGNKNRCTLCCCCS